MGDEPPADADAGRDGQPPAGNLTLLGCGVVFLGLFVGGTWLILAIAGDVLGRPILGVRSTKGLWLVMAGLMLVGRWLLNRGRKRDRQHAGLHATTEVPPGFVLYLRSFADDRLGETLVVPNPTYGTPTTEEEELVEALREIGPVVAVANPADELPPIGAVRLAVEAAAWQDTVARLMREARLVVARAGTTEGLRWELRQAAQTVEPTRLVIVVAHDRERYAAFKRLADGLFPRPLPDYVAPPRSLGMRALPPHLSLRGFIRFDADWSGHFLRIPALRLNYLSLHPMLRVLQQALQPVRERLDA